LSLIVRRSVLLKWAVVAQRHGSVGPYWDLKGRTDSRILMFAATVQNICDIRKPWTNGGERGV
jgi:hypothetical protein